MKVLILIFTTKGTKDTKGTKVKSKKNNDNLVSSACSVVNFAPYELCG